MELGLKNKVALVTGAGSQVGFGKGIATTLAKEGCKVIVSDIDLAGAKQTVAEIEAQGGQALAVKCDITKVDEVQAMVKAGEAKFGPVDILVNNAGGIFNMTLFAEKTDAEILRDINLNLIGPMNCIRAVIKPMLARKSGKIISVASIGANKGIPYTTVYNACKAGIVSMTKSLAVDYGPQGINVNCISPGLGLTKFGGAPPPPEIMKEALSMTPARRTTTPQDMANAVVYLASDMSTDIMGQNLAVDGGTNVI